MQLDQTAGASSPPDKVPGLSPTSLGIIMEPGEQILAFVRKHIIGIVFIYIEVLAGIAALLAFSYLIIVPTFFGNISGTGYRLLISSIIFALAILIFVLFVATYIYRQNSILITNESIIQILQRSLFSRKASRVSMTDVEDVSADSMGILATMFGYGTLTIETAGEQHNFKFTHCPHPDKYAHLILETRQKYLEDLERLGNTPQPPPSPLR